MLASKEETVTITKIKKIASNPIRETRRLHESNQLVQEIPVSSP